MDKLYALCADAIRDCYFTVGQQVYAYWLDRDGSPVAVKPYDAVYPMYGEWGGYVIAEDEEIAWEKVCTILCKPRGASFK